MLHNHGLTQLLQECGELVQAIAKYTTFRDEKPDEGVHWDDKNVSESLENEIADVLAAAFVVIENLELDNDWIADRKQYKKTLFRYWHKGGKETSIPWPSNGKFGTADVAGS